MEWPWDMFTSIEAVDAELSFGGLCWLCMDKDHHLGCHVGPTSSGRPGNPLYISASAQ